MVKTAFSLRGAFDRFTGAKKNPLARVRDAWRDSRAAADSARRSTKLRREMRRKDDIRRALRDEYRKGSAYQDARAAKIRKAAYTAGLLGIGSYGVGKGLNMISSKPITINNITKRQG